MMKTSTVVILKGSYYYHLLFSLSFASSYLNSFHIFFLQVSEVTEYSRCLVLFRYKLFWCYLKKVVTQFDRYNWGGRGVYCQLPMSRNNDTGHRRVAHTPYINISNVYSWDWRAGRSQRNFFLFAKEFCYALTLSLL